MRLIKRSFLLFLYMFYASNVFAQGDSSEIHKIVEQTMGQARENISRMLKEHAQAKDPTSKFLLSSLIVELTKGGTFKDYPSIGQQISDQDRKTIAAIVKEFDKIQEQVKQFESSLTKEDVEKIVQDNPASIFKKLGIYSSMWNLGECTKEKYEAAKKTLDESGRYQNYPDVSALVTLYDGLYVAEYHNRTRELLSTEKKYAKFKPLGETFYFDLAKTGQNPKDLIAEIKQNIDMVEKKFRENKANKRTTDIKAYVLQTTAAHPECLAGFNKDFWNMWKTELTTERGAYWLDKLKKNKKLKCDNAAALMGALSLDKASTISSSHADADGINYYFSAKGTSCEMRAMGVNTQDTSDDILIGSF